MRKPAKNIKGEYIIGRIRVKEITVNLEGPKNNRCSQKFEQSRDAIPFL
jgi:hypothetical protein